MSNSNVDLLQYPIDAAYQVMLEMVKAGAFNGVGDRGTAFVNTFTKIKDHFEKIQNEQLNPQ